MHGIDISHYQSVNYNEISQDFVILKASQGKTYTDSKFEQHYHGLKDKTRLGCYVYNKVYNAEDAVVEANHLLSVINGKDFPAGVWLDVEDVTMKGLGKSMLNKIINTEAEIIRNAGYNVGIYCSEDWYKNVLDVNYLSRSYLFWIARYYGNDGNFTLEHKNDQLGKKNVVIWQYSSKGRVSGVNGNCDADITNLNIEEVLALYGGAKVTPKLYPKYSGLGVSLIGCLKAVGETDTSFEHRAKIARKNGIVNYKGTASQNLSMVAKLKQGTLLKA